MTHRIPTQQMAILCGALALVVSVGVACTKRAAPTVQGLYYGMPHTAAMCPMNVEHTMLKAEDTEDGAALVFTTTGDVAELRRRVVHMTRMHVTSKATADVEEIEGGARVVLTPKEPDELTALRSRVHDMAEPEADECPLGTHE